MKSHLKYFLAITFILLVILACLIDEAEAKKKKKKKPTEDKKVGGKPVGKPGISVRSSGAKQAKADDLPLNDELDPEMLEKIRNRIKEKPEYADLLKKRQAGLVSEDDPKYQAMLDDLVKATVKVELTEIGTEIVEERPMTPEEIAEEELRQAEFERTHHGKDEL